MIIFLNGPSSAGKSTLAKALQSALPTPYLYFASDRLVQAGMLPAVDRAATDGAWAWRTVRPRFFDGFHRCIAALAGADNDLIVEHVLEFAPWLNDCVRLLAPFDVFFVGVHCSLEEMERRERERGDRQIGEGRAHLEDGVHTFGPYDFEVDTSQGSTQIIVDRIVNGLAVRPHPSAFQRMRSNLEP